jgi:predicted RNase H-like HicB family nuclease
LKATYPRLVNQAGDLLSRKSLSRAEYQLLGKMRFNNCDVYDGLRLRHKFITIEYTAYCRLHQNRLKSPLPKALVMKQIKIILEKHSDGYVAYPLGIKGAIVGQGDTYEEALADVKSAIRCYVEIFGKEMLEDESPVIEAFLTEAEVAI